MRRFRKNVFTGDMEEIDDDPITEFDAIREKHSDKYRHIVTKRNGTAYDSAHPWVTNTLSVHISQMEQFNADAKRHNTGAEYRPDPRNPQRAQLVCPTKRSRLRELRRRGGPGEPIVDFDSYYD